LLETLGFDALLVLGEGYQRGVDEINHLGFARPGRAGGGIDLRRHRIDFARLLAGEIGEGAHRLGFFRRRDFGRPVGRQPGGACRRKGFQKEMSSAVAHDRFSFEAACLRYRVMPRGATFTAPYMLPLGAMTTPSPACSSGTKYSALAWEMLPIHTPFFQPPGWVCSVESASM